MPIRLYGTQALCRRYAPQFPASLSGAPLLLPARLSRLRQLLDDWLSERGVQIELVGEFDDADALCLFGCAGHGLFPVGTALSPEVEKHPEVVGLGELPGLSDRFYAIATERRVRRSEMRLLLQEAAARYDQGAAVAEEAAQCFAEAAQAADLVGPFALQVHGASGFMRDYPVEKYMRELKTLSLMLGGIDAHKRLVLTPRRVELSRWPAWASPTRAMSRSIPPTQALRRNTPASMR